MAEFLRDLIGNGGTRVNVMQIPKISLALGFLSSFICFWGYLRIYAKLESIFYFPPTAKPLLFYTGFILAFIVVAYVAVTVGLHVMTKQRKILVSVGVLIGLVIGGMFSYAMMQSGRGRGDTPESDLLRATWVQEQPADISSALTRMIHAGVIPENITFTGAATANDVFDQEHGGGGATDIPPPTDACSPHCTRWTYLTAVTKDSGWYVHGVNTSAADIIAYLPNITPKVCRIIQQKNLGFMSFTPPKQAGASFDPAKPGVYSATGNTTTIKSEDDTLDGQREGCFDNHVGDPGDSSFSYYAVLYAQ